MIYDICEFVGISFFWILLNSRTFFLEKDKRHYYTFAELWKGRTYLFSKGKPDERPYTTIGFIILFTIIFIAMFIT